MEQPDRPGQTLLQFVPLAIAVGTAVVGEDHAATTIATAIAAAVAAAIATTVSATIATCQKLQKKKRQREGL